jgi:pilus assembly protein CpaC
MHSHRPISTLRRCLVGGAALVTLTTAYYSFAAAQEPLATAAQEPMVTGTPTPPPAAGQGDVTRIEIGESATLRSPTGKKLSKVFASRPGIAEVTADEKDPTIVKVTGRNVGAVDITLVEETGAATKVTLRVLPDMSYIRDTIKRHFPRTNLTLERVGENTVVVTGDVEMAEQISGIIQLVDSMVGKGYAINNMRLAGVVQVQLEVCIAQVNRQETRNMGFNWLQSSPNSVTTSTLGGILQTPSQLQVGTLTQRTIPPGFTQGFGNLGTGLGVANLSIGVFDENSAFFGYIEALRQENLAKIMAHPTVTTLSGRPANFKVGGEEPFGTSGSGGGTGTGIEFKPFGTVVRFVPIALGNGKLRIEVQSEVSNVRRTVETPNIVAPALDTTSVSTTVEMESGQTMAIGGLLQNRVTGATAKVPVLGDLPFVGAGFRKVTYFEEETEVLIIITPHVVDPLDCYQRPSRLPGQETRTATDFELFLEGILEAPRGQRELCPDGKYRPAHYWAPPHCYPYGTPKPGCGNCGACGTGCGTGYGASGHVSTGVRPVVNVAQEGRPATVIPAAAEQPQVIPQDTNPVLPPQQPVVPAVYVPESNQPQTEQAPMPAGNQPPSPEAKESTPVTPVPSEPVKPMDK